MILIGLGSNLDGPWGTPRQTVERALEVLDDAPLCLIKSSALIETAPFGKSDQPNFINAAAWIETRLSAINLLRHLHEIEGRARRSRVERWGPRTLDLDLLDYDGLLLSQPAIDNLLVEEDQKRRFELPHPGIAERDFVLKPLAEIVPNWIHPVNGLTAEEMLKKLS